MQTRSKSGAPPPPVAPPPEGPGPRQLAALEMAAQLQADCAGLLDPAARALCWVAVELGRQGDLLDRLTGLLPAAEAAAARLGNSRVAGLLGRGGPAAAVDMSGGRKR